MLSVEIVIVGEEEREEEEEGKEEEAEEDKEEEEEEEEERKEEEREREEEGGTEVVPIEYRLPLCFVNFFRFRGFGRLSVIIPPRTISSTVVRTRKWRGIWVLVPSNAILILKKIKIVLKKKKKRKERKRKEKKRKEKERKEKEIKY